MQAFVGYSLEPSLPIPLRGDTNIRIALPSKSSRYFLPVPYSFREPVSTDKLEQAIFLIVVISVKHGFNAARGDPIAQPFDERTVLMQRIDGPLLCGTSQARLCLFRLCKME